MSRFHQNDMTDICLFSKIVYLRENEKKGTLPLKSKSSVKIRTMIFKLKRKKIVRTSWPIQVTCVCHTSQLAHVCIVHRIRKWFFFSSWSVIDISNALVQVDFFVFLFGYLNQVYSSDHLFE